jgi:hypothetical protein
MIIIKKWSFRQKKSAFESERSKAQITNIDYPFVTLTLVAHGPF